VLRATQVNTAGGTDTSGATFDSLFIAYAKFPLASGSVTTRWSPRHARIRRLNLTVVPL